MEAIHGAQDVRTVRNPVHTRLCSKYLYEKIKEIKQIFEEHKKSLQSSSRWLFCAGGACLTTAVGTYGLAVYNSPTHPHPDEDYRGVEEAMAAAAGVLLLAGFFWGSAMGASRGLDVPLDALDRVIKHLDVMEDSSRREAIRQG